MFCQQLLDTSIAACIIPFTNFQAFQAWVSKKLPIIFVIKKMKSWKGVPEEMIAGQAVRKQTSNPELRPYWPPIVLAGTLRRVPLLHCTQPAALRQNLPIYQEGENPYRYNHLEHQKEHLLDPPPDQRLHTKPCFPQRKRKKQ